MASIDHPDIFAEPPDSNTSKPNLPEPLLLDNSDKSLDGDDHSSLGVNITTSDENDIEILLQKKDNQPTKSRKRKHNNSSSDDDDDDDYKPPDDEEDFTILESPPKKKKRKTTAPTKEEKNNTDSDDDNNDKDDSDYEPVVTTKKKTPVKRKSIPRRKKKSTSNSRGRKSTCESDDDEEEEEEEKKTRKKGSKEKGNTSKKVGGDKATEMIFDFLKLENRPWNYKGVADFVKKENIGLAQVKRSIAKLVEENKIVQKQFGNKEKKIFIVWYNQALFQQDKSVFENLEKEMKELECEVKEKKKEKNVLFAEMQSLEGSKTMKQIENELGMLRKEHGEKQRKVREIQKLEVERKMEESKKKNKNGGEMNKKESMNDKLLKFYEYGKAWKERKRVTYDMVEQMWAENSKKPFQILRDTLHCETDRDLKIDFNKYKELLDEATKVFQNASKKKGTKKK